MKIFIFLACFVGVYSIGCKDQNGKDVDWFMGYKMPKQDDSTPPGIANGVGYYYMDSNLPGDLSPSSNDLSSSSQVRKRSKKIKKNQRFLTKMLSNRSKNALKSSRKISFFISKNAKLNTHIESSVLGRRLHPPTILQSTKRPKPHARHVQRRNGCRFRRKIRLLVVLAQNKSQGFSWKQSCRIWAY